MRRPVCFLLEVVGLLVSLNSMPKIYFCVPKMVFFRQSIYNLGCPLGHSNFVVATKWANPRSTQHNRNLIAYHKPHLVGQIPSLACWIQEFCLFTSPYSPSSSEKSPSFTENSTCFLIFTRCSPDLAPLPAGKSTLLSALSGTLGRRYHVSGHIWSNHGRRVGVSEGSFSPAFDGGKCWKALYWYGTPPEINVCTYLCYK